MIINKIVVGPQQHDVIFVPYELDNKKFKGY